MESLCNKRKKQITTSIADTSCANLVVTMNSYKKKDISSHVSICGYIFKNEMPFSQFNEDYMDMEVLGNGAFGVVQKVRHIKTNEIRAMKIINRKNMTEEGKQLIKEISILKKLVNLLIIGSSKYFEII